MFNLPRWAAPYESLLLFSKNRGREELEILMTSESRSDHMGEDEEKGNHPSEGKRSSIDMLRTSWKSLSVLLPSFLSLDGNGRQSASARRPHSTSSLDGLRGLAAYAVMNYHILYAFQSFVFYGYGLSHNSIQSCGRPEDLEKTTNWFHQLPILRLIYSGTWPISVFFVVSGYVLSYKPILEANSFSESTASKAAATTAARMLRRPIRLYLPPIVATMVTMAAIQLGAYEPGRQVALHSHWIPVIQETHHQRMGSLGAQVLDWLHQTWKMCRVFWWGEFNNPYDVHLWTIPAEFRCSLSVFLVLPAYISMRPIARRLLMATIIIYVYLLDRWDVALFFAGLLAADTSITCREQASGALQTTHRRPSHRVVFTAARALAIFASLYFLSSPDFCMSSTPGYQLLSRLIPSSDPAPFRFLPNIGGVLLVVLVTHVEVEKSMVNKLLNSALLQYLGKISFSLYIVHGPLVHTVGYAVFPFFWKISGTEDVWRYVVGFVAGYVVLVTVVIWVADVFWRLIDLPSTSIAVTAQQLLSGNAEYV